MNFEKYTERARGFVQSAQSLAVRENNQQFTPEHLLKVLLDDPEGLASGLITKAGGNAREALTQTELLWRNCRRCKAPEPVSFISHRRPRGCSTMPNRSRRRRAIPSSPSSVCCWRSRSKRAPTRPRSCSAPASPPQVLNAAIEDLRKGRTADNADRRERL